MLGAEGKRHRQSDAERKEGYEASLHVCERERGHQQMASVSVRLQQEEDASRRKREENVFVEILGGFRTIPFKIEQQSRVSQVI